MRHLRKTSKLGRKSAHRRAMLANMVCSLIEHNRITTTVERAKAARAFADKMVTLGKKGTLHHRRQAIAALKQKDAVAKLFSDIAPRFKERAGGYTRIIRIGQRRGDAAHTAILEWTEGATPVAPAEGDKTEKKAETKQ
jgi:large subunit ribosomal protein L17